MAEDHDIISVLVPKGTKQRIQATGETITRFVNAAIEERLESHSGIVKSTLEGEKGIKKGGDELLSVKMKVEAACSREGITVTELAQRMGTSQANMAKRLKVGKFTQDEMVAIGKALGARYYSGFEFPDGSKIE